jgi:hypothetical protein
MPSFLLPNLLGTHTENSCNWQVFKFRKRQSGNENSPKQDTHRHSSRVKNGIKKFLSLLFVASKHQIRHYQNNELIIGERAPKGGSDDRSGDRDGDFCYRDEAETCTNIFLKRARAPAPLMSQFTRNRAREKNRRGPPLALRTIFRLLLLYFCSLTTNTKKMPTDRRNDCKLS